MGWIWWDPEPKLFTLPGLNWPIYWYGVFFALGFFLGFPLYARLLKRVLQERFPQEKTSFLKERAYRLTDQLSLYVALGAVLGARFAHVFFYEPPSFYLETPWKVLFVWEGGLASHGGVLGILLGLWLFSLREKGMERLSFLDCLAAPAALGGVCIRLGNFFGQEILGTPSEVPWAVVFGHPMDRSLPLPRHPVQLYEALFYLFLFLLFWRLSRKAFFFQPGRTTGLFLMILFSFRFVIEFWKLEQSSLMSSGLFTMGQYLSLPLVVLGAFLYRPRGTARSQGG